MRNFKLQLAAIFTLSLVTGMAFAGSIKSWSNGQTLTAADLNANFNHIHGLMVGGHGARLVDADVSGSAAIASSKLAQGSGIADAWGVANGSMTNSFVEGFNMTGVTHAAAATTYTFTGAAGLDGNGVVLVQCSTAATLCSGSIFTTTVDVTCSVECSGILRVVLFGL